MATKDAEIVKFASEDHLLKADSLIDVTESGMINSTSDEQLQKVFFPIKRTEEGIET